ncbi:MAG: tetratricopeptide repeat protein [Cyclobacteriaceae bacterium]|nr:tetratricopeptide repeat protein [Cyclobacteriaceae bacterium]
MRKFLTYWLVIALCFPGFCTVAQDQLKLDSLQLQLQYAKADTTKIQTLIEIARFYQTYNYALSAEYARNACDLAEKKGLKEWEGKANRVLGLTQFNMGDYKKATASYLKSLRFYEDAKDTSGIMAINNNLGVVHDRLKDFDRALEYYFKVQDLYNRSNPNRPNPFPLPSLYNNIANIYQTKGDFKSALQYYEKSLALAMEGGNKAVQGVALNNIGKLYFIDLEQPELALEYLLKGLNIREETGDKAEIAKSLVFLSGYYNQQGNFEEGKRYSNRAINLGSEIGSLEVQLSAYSGLSDAENGLGKFKESLAAFKNFKRINDSIQSKSTSSEITRLQLQYDFEKAEQLQKQEQKQARDRYIATIIVLCVCLLIAVLVVVLIRSRARQTELKQKNLVQDVEIKNKELTTNVMYLIRKNELINNVAERLLSVQKNVHPDNHKVFHDIILDLQREADNDSWKEFELRFNQVHNDFYIKLRNLYPDLSPAEEKLCAFLRLNMSSKEIAAITQQSIKSVEVARARLRKKLNLTNTNSNLVTHLSNL